jgi:hypothetical protein
MNLSLFGPLSGPTRWFGVFVHSDGDRILFFPGFDEPHSIVQKHRGLALVEEARFTVDHATLEKDRRTWHMTSTPRGVRSNVPNTVDLGESRTLWFGLSVSSFEAMRVLRKKTLVEVNVPVSDHQRRSSILEAARRDAEFNLLTLNPEVPPPETHFLHFTVIVGPSGFRDYSGPQFAFPYDNPHLHEPLPDPLLRIPIRLHRVKLSATTDVQVITSALPGALKIPMAFTTPIA